jgi:hypothetical protein
MKTTPAKLDVRYDTSALLGGGRPAESERASVCRQIRRLVQPYANDRAALVLIFGGGSDITAAQSSAAAIGQHLPCSNSKVFRPNTPYRDFWNGRLSSGYARLEVFFFTTS